jgi:hypothetical protein
VEQQFNSTLHDAAAAGKSRAHVSFSPSLSIFQPDCKTTGATTTSNASAAVAANANSAALSTITKVASQRTPPLHSKPRTPAFPLISPLHSHTAQERDAMAAELARLRQALASVTGGDPNLTHQTSHLTPQTSNLKHYCST